MKFFLGVGCGPETMRFFAEFFKEWFSAAEQVTVGLEKSNGILLSTRHWQLTFYGLGFARAPTVTDITDRHTRDWVSAAYTPVSSHLVSLNF